MWHDSREYDKAIQDYGKAIELSPAWTLAYSNRGKAWYDKREYDRAIADCDKVIELDGRDFEAYFVRGCVRYVKGEYDKAIADYGKVIEAHPESNRVYSQGDTIHFYEGNYATLARAYSNRAAAWQGKGEYDKAIADCDKAIKIDPKNALLYENRGRAFEMNGEYDKAMTDYNRVTVIEPENRRTLNALAWLLATCPADNRRDGPRAVEIARRACELTEWKSWTCLDTLAAAYAEAGDFREAVECQSKAIQLTQGDGNKRAGQARLDLYNARKPCRGGGPKVGPPLFVPVR